ncbi:MAG: OmpH family outer membrane protein [Nitrospirae bacterium]|nr:OmpH family outer membrane protein [Nitrospirota bacterium]
MKRTVLMFIMVLLVAATAAASEQFKVGVIDLQRAVIESEGGKKARSDFESLIKTKQAVADEKANAIDKLKADLDKQASVLSADAKKAKEEELDKLMRDYQRLVNDAQADIKKKEGELTEAILKDIHEIIGAFAQEEGYDIVLPKDLSVYSKKEIDITDIIVKKFNESKEKSKEEPKEKSKEKPKGKK